MSLSRVVLMPWKIGSQSAGNLATSLSTALNARVRRLYTDDRSRFVGRSINTVINWGNSVQPDQPRLNDARVINAFDKVKLASNKVLAFQALSAANVTIPNFTQSRDEAVERIRSGDIIVCRQKINAHSGEGIVIAAREEELVDAPLYVSYVKKKKEFRVHVVFGQVADIQEKRKRRDYEGETNYAVRNHHTGWVYCREDIVEPDGLRDIAIKATEAVGLDFGAVDIIWNEYQNRCYVLEINTAPGLEGTTVDNYVAALLPHL